MSILLDETTRVCVVGITGGRAAADTAINLDYGTRIVAGVAPAAPAGRSPASRCTTPAPTPPGTTRSTR